MSSKKLSGSSEAANFSNQPFYASFNCNQNKLSDETTELAPCLAQLSISDHDLLDDITDETEYDHVIDLLQKTQKAARQTLKDAKRFIDVSSQSINPLAATQIEPLAIARRVPQINLHKFSCNFTA